MPPMSYVPYQYAKAIADRFLNLLSDRGITPPNGSGPSMKCWRWSTFWKSGATWYGLRTKPARPEIIRCAAGIRGLAAKVLSAL